MMFNDEAREKARIEFAASGATLHDVRMMIREHLIYAGRTWDEADALILLHEAAVTRA